MFEVKNVARRFLLLLVIVLMIVIPVKADTIRWVNFDVPYESLSYAMKQDVEISLKNAANKWEVFQKKASSAMVAGDYNRVAVDTHCKNTDFAINTNDFAIFANR